MKTMEERFWAKVEMIPDGCWVWTACTDRDGYGRFSARTQKGWRSFSSHKLSYEMVNGPTPDGLQLDHLCRNRDCVNPLHLEPVTSKENTHRGDTPAARNAAKTHCPKGHSYAGENLYVYNGSRECRECSRARSRRHMRQKRRKTNG